MHHPIQRKKSNISMNSYMCMYTYVPTVTMIIRSTTAEWFFLDGAIDCFFQKLLDAEEKNECELVSGRSTEKSDNIYKSHHMPSVFHRTIK